MADTRLTFVITVYGWSPDELRKAVSDLDHVNDTPGIDPANVRAEHVLEALLSGEFNPEWETLEDSMDSQ